MIVDARRPDRALRGRIWLNELPPWNFLATGHIERSYPANRPGQASRCEAAIEFSKWGDPAHYGGLAICFAPGADAQLRVSIPYTTDIGASLANPYPVGPNYAHVALRREYVDSIMRGIEEGDAAMLLGSGVLDFPGATHHEIDSAPYVFTVMTRILLDALTRPDAETLSAEEWWALLHEHYQRPWRSER